MNKNKGTIKETKTEHMKEYYFSDTNWNCWKQNRRRISTQSAQSFEEEYKQTKISIFFPPSICRCRNWVASNFTLFHTNSFWFSYISLIPTRFCPISQSITKVINIAKLKTKFKRNRQSLNRIQVNPSLMPKYVERKSRVIAKQLRLSDS